MMLTIIPEPLNDIVNASEVPQNMWDYLGRPLLSGGQVKYIYRHLAVEKYC